MSRDRGDEAGLAFYDEQEEREGDVVSYFAILETEFRAGRSFSYAYGPQPIRTPPDWLGSFVFRERARGDWETDYRRARVHSVDRPRSPGPVYEEIVGAPAPPETPIVVELPPVVELSESEFERLLPLFEAFIADAASLEMIVEVLLPLHRRLSPEQIWHLKDLGVQIEAPV